MADTNDATAMEPKKPQSMQSDPEASCAVYGLGFLGTVVYYIAQATTFLGGRVGCTQSHYLACDARVQAAGVF